MGAEEFIAPVLGVLSEVEDTAAAVGLAVKAHGAELGNEKLGNLLAAAGTILARLRSLQAMLPAVPSAEGLGQRGRSEEPRGGKKMG
jgi:hypothetical protein